MRDQQRKGPSYLDVAEYILTGPEPLSESPCPAPLPSPVPSQPAVLQAEATPLSQPLFIEVERSQPSPYLKELLQNSEVQFMDFTLEGPAPQDYQDHWDEQQPPSQQMSVIEEEEEEDSDSRQVPANPAKFEYDPNHYVPNMHLLQMEPKTLSLEHFHEHMRELEGKGAGDDEVDEFVSLYMTDTDITKHKKASMQTLFELVADNLARRKGGLSRLQRKARVAMYLQKKRRRIFKKKVSYHCRKQVADNRLRIKGKFATPDQLHALSCLTD